MALVQTARITIFQWDQTPISVRKFISVSRTTPKQSGRTADCGCGAESGSVQTMVSRQQIRPMYGTCHGKSWKNISTSSRRGSTSKVLLHSFLVFAGGQPAGELGPYNDWCIAYTMAGWPRIYVHCRMIGFCTGPRIEMFFNLTRIISRVEEVSSNMF